MPIQPPSTPLVGRADELRELAGLIGLDAGPHGATLLGGDAGAGKSRLTAELVTRATGAGWQVLLGHCLDLGDGAPAYLPFSEALGRLAGEQPEAAAALRRADASIARLLPSRRRLQPAGPQEAEPTGPSTLYDAVHATLSDLSANAPLLLVVEDLHWADQSTRDLLRFLFTRGFGEPVAILATYRSDDLHRSHPLRADLAEWGRLPGVARLQLGPLPDAEALALVHELAGDTIPPEDRHRIIARAEGNAFFIEELVAATAAGGGELPADLADLLLVRLDRLSDDARLAVRAAAVAGRRVSHELLRHGTDLDGAALDTALRAAVEANVLVPSEREAYAFRHALLRDAVYQDLLPGERVRLHGAFAAAITDGRVHAAPAELARHARASHDTRTALLAGIRAGDEAMAVGGPQDAAHQYELALELLTDPQTAAAVDISRVDLVIRASRAARAAGNPFRAAALAEQELAMLPADAPPLDRVRMIQTLVRTAQFLDMPRDLLGLTTEAVRLLGEAPDDRVRAGVLHLHARVLADHARDDEAARWANEALALAQQLDLPAVATDATLLLAQLDERSGDPERAEEAMTGAIAAAAAAGEPMAELRGLYRLAMLQYGQGRLEASLANFRLAVERARGANRQWEQFGLEAAVIGAIVAHVAGEWDLAASLVDTSGATPPEPAAAMLTAVAMEVAAGRGDMQALRHLRWQRSWWERDGLIAVTGGGAAIELLGQSGDLDAAIETFDLLVDHIGGMWEGKRFMGRLRLSALLLGHLAHAAGAASAGERKVLVDRGDEIASTAVEIMAAGRRAGPEGTAWAARIAAEQARLHWRAGIDPPPVDDLVARWREAQARFADFGHVFETARSQARLAEVLLAAGRAEEARATAAAARETAVRLGAKPLLAELRATPGSGGRADPGERGRTESLTPREIDVLRQVATGRSNRDIAGQLFISAKTVSVHISNLMAKLGAASRTEAVAIARRRGLL